MNIEELKAHGFVEATYEGKDGVSLVKKRKVEDFPYAKEHMVDNEYIYGDSDAFMEVTPDGCIKFVIPDSDYIEGPVALDSEEGSGLLKDALAAK